MMHQHRADRGLRLETKYWIAQSGGMIEDAGRRKRRLAAERSTQRRQRSIKRPEARGQEAQTQRRRAGRNVTTDISLSIQRC